MIRLEYADDPYDYKQILLRLIPDRMIETDHLGEIYA